jgi:hypothetical protein
MPVVGDIDIYRGEDVPIDMDVPNSTVTGGTYVMTVRPTVSFTTPDGTPDPDPLFVVQGVVQGPNDVIFVLTSDLTDGLAPGPYEYDMWRTDTGNKTEYRRGRLNVQQRVS